MHIKKIWIQTNKGQHAEILSFAVAKMKHKHVPKKSPHEPSNKENSRVFLDILTIKAPKGIKAKVTKSNLIIIVDEHSGLKFSQFYYTKDLMVEPTCELLNKRKQKLIQVR